MRQNCLRPGGGRIVRAPTVSLPPPFAYLPTPTTGLRPDEG